MTSDLETTLPPGRYWIGDPCQILTDERYDQLFSEKCEARMRTVEGNVICLSSTSDGDGFYQCQIGGAIIESGQIGIVPYNLIEEGRDPDMTGVVIDATSCISVHLGDGIHEFEYNDTNGPVRIEFEFEN